MRAVERNGQKGYGSTLSLFRSASQVAGARWRFAWAWTVGVVLALFAAAPAAAQSLCPELVTYRLRSETSPYSQQPGTGTSGLLTTGDLDNNFSIIEELLCKGELKVEDLATALDDGCTIISSSGGWDCGGTMVTVHATACAGVTAKSPALCYELDDNTVYICDLAAGSSCTGANWTATSGGGGGTPGGADTQVQYNDGGSFSGDAGLVYDEADDTLRVGGVVESDVWGGLTDPVGDQANWLLGAYQIYESGIQVALFDASVLVLGNAAGENLFLGTAMMLDDDQPLRFYEEDANGSNYFEFDPPAAITSNRTCTIEDDANPIADSCVGDGVDDDDPESIPLETANMVTGIADDEIPVGTGTDDVTFKAVPDCDDSGGNHLNYDTGTNAFTCGTTGDGGGGGAIAVFAYTAAALEPLEAGDLISSLVANFGTNVDYLLANFGETGTLCRQIGFPLPDVDTSGTATFRLVGIGAATSAVSPATVRWAIGYNAGLAEGTTSDVAFTTSEFSDDLPATETNTFVTSTTISMATLGWDDGEWAEVRFCRDGADGGDDYDTSVRLRAVSIEVPLD